MQCQTQLQAKSPGENVPLKMAASCPAKTGNHLLLPNTSVLSKDKDQSKEAASSANDAIDDIFEKSQAELDFGCANSLQKQVTQRIVLQIEHESKIKLFACL